MPVISLRYSPRSGYTVWIDGEQYTRAQEKRTMARRPKPTRPLTCYGKLPDGSTCGEQKRLRITGSSQQLRLGNRDGSMSTRRVATVECKNCGNEWQSRHPDALAATDKHDLMRERRHGRQKKATA